MACSGCGSKKRTLNTLKPQVPDYNIQKFNKRIQPLNQKIRKHNASKNVEFIKNQPLSLTETYTGQPISILSSDRQGKYVYLITNDSINNQKGISDYIKRTLFFATKKWNINNIKFIEIDSSLVLDSHIPISDAPTTAFVENGELVKYFQGFDKDLRESIKKFSEGSVDEEQVAYEKSVEKNNYKIFTLEASPSLSEAYSKFMETQLEEDILKVNTFVDEKNNKLIVTIVYKT